MIVYDLGNIADWLTAIGTIGAVIVSLYFSFNNIRTKKKIIKNVRESPIDNIYEFILINKGFVPINVQIKGFMVYKRFWKKHKKNLSNRITAKTSSIGQILLS